VNPLDELARMLPKPPASHELPTQQQHKSELITIITVGQRRRRALRSQASRRWFAPAMAAAAVAVVAVLAVAVPALVGIGSGSPSASQGVRSRASAGATGASSAGAQAPSPAGSRLTATRRWSVAASRFHAVAVFIDHGSITVVGGRASAAAITATPRFGGQAPVLGSQVLDDTLVVRARCPRERLCQVALTLRVPAGVAVRTTSDLGAVRVTGLHGGVTVSAWEGGIVLTDLSGRVAASDDLGDLTLTNLSGSITASTDAGSIKATGLTATQVTLSSHAGDITTEFSAAPRHVTASSQLGDVVLGLPTTVTYNVHASTQLGHVSIKVPRSTGSANVIKASSQLGSVTVTG
jgi:hypothetical protein